MKLITIKQLHELEGSVWADNISNEITGANVLLWHAASELASFIELYLPVEQASEVAPEAIQVLEGAADHFADLDVPRPLTVEALLLRLARHKTGVDPDYVERDEQERRKPGERARRRRLRRGA